MKRLFFLVQKLRIFQIHSRNEETLFIYNLGILLFFNFQNELVSPYKFFACHLK
jgi:hypothetical protein